jgi:hypothetical protein
VGSVVGRSVTCDCLLVVSSAPGCG